MNYAIQDIERQASDGLVTKVKWAGTYVDESEYASAEGEVTLERSDTVVPFDELTEATVLGWVFEKIDTSEIEQALKNKVFLKKQDKSSPSVLTGVPWAAPAAEESE
tara:strand:+ start:797 stop:1117 length:321 start_codon:yes stop_codon:yes gene_type:complete